jgi:hypothetical protein
LFSFLIEVVNGELTELVIDKILFIKCLLQQASGLRVVQAVGVVRRRAVACYFVMLDALGRRNQGCAITSSVASSESSYQFVFGAITGL